MRISDWSSDVCSSDLQIFGLGEFVADLASQLTAVQTAMLFEGEQDLLGVGTHRGLGFKSRRRHVPASRCGRPYGAAARTMRSEEHTSELQSLMRISYAVFCLKKKNKHIKNTNKRIQRKP